MTLGENLQKLRAAKGLSQQDVARTLYVSRQSVPNGRMTPPSRGWRI